MASQPVGDDQTRRFRSPAPLQVAGITRHPTLPNQQFEPLPQPTGSTPFHLALSDVLPAARIAAIDQAGRLVFHCVGDTGGIMQANPQQIVANHMDADCADASSPECPSFFYHLGDIVYFYGEAASYYGQFYEPYSHYPGPILPIPGNHDGDRAPGSTAPSLQAFVENFCATAPRPTQAAGDTARDAMTLPNVYWTLEAPFATIIGLYTNVPEGGQMDDAQKGWLAAELRGAPTDRALLLSMHHPILSLDNFHSGSAYMHDVVEQAVTDAGRLPDLVLAGHVHNYQRFTRTWNGHAVPFIVAGAGGYHNLHYMSSDLPRPIQLPLQVPASAVSNMQATLDAFNDDHHGYLVLEVDSTRIKGDYFIVPRPQDSWSAPAVNLDSFALNWHTHQYVSGTTPRPAAQPRGPAAAA